MSGSVNMFLYEFDFLNLDVFVLIGIHTTILIKIN